MTSQDWIRKAREFISLGVFPVNQQSIKQEFLDTKINDWTYISSGKVPEENVKVLVIDSMGDVYAVKRLTWPDDDYPAERYNTWEGDSMTFYDNELKAWMPIPSTEGV